jgi:thioesterase domain-containing protein
MLALEREIGVRLPLATLFQTSTVQALARVLRRKSETSPERSLDAVHPGGSQPSVSWVHPAGGGVLCYAGFAHPLDPSLPFYALQARELNGEDLPAMAACVEEELPALQPVGPYQIGGWSLEGLIVFEIARQLRREGQEVPPLLLLDTHLPGPDLAPERMSSRQLLALALQLGIRPEGLAAEQEKLGDADAAGQLQPLLERAYEMGVVPTDSRRSYGVFLANLWTAAYRPKPLEGRFVLFRASDRVDPDLWRPLAVGLKVVALPGDHYSTLRKPHLNTVANRFRERLLDPGRSAGQ